MPDLNTGNARKSYQGSPIGKRWKARITVAAIQPADNGSDNDTSLAKIYRGAYNTVVIWWGEINYGIKVHNLNLDTKTVDTKGFERRRADLSDS